MVVACFIAFDSLSTIAAETENPRRSIPRILYTVVLAGAPIILISLIFTASVVTNHTDAFIAGESPMSILANSAGVPWMSIPLDLFIALSTMAMGITVLSFGGRFVATMAEIGLLPRYLAKINQKRENPTRAVIALGAISIGAPLAFAFIAGGSSVDLSITIGTQLGYAWSLSYVVVSILAIWLIATRHREAWFTALCGVVAAVGFIAFEANVLKDGFGNKDSTDAWVAIIAVFVAFVWFVIVHRSRKGESIDLTVIDQVE